MLASLARPSRGASVTWSPLDDRWYQQFGSNRADAGPVIVPEAALSVAVLYRAINVLAHAVASIPLNVYRRLDDDGKERAREHPQFDLLHTQPNRWMTSFRWRHLCIVQSILWGDHYSEIMPGFGGIGGIAPLNPDTTRIVDQLNDGRLIYLTRDKTKTGWAPERKLVQDEVFHLRGFSIDGKSGIPLTRSAKNAIGLALIAERHGSLFLKKGARHAGFLSTDGYPPAEKQTDIEKGWQRSNGGVEGTGTTPLLIGGVKFNPVSVNNKDSQWLEARDFEVQELLRFVGVPGVLCGYADKTATYASAEQFFLSFVTNTVHPLTANFAAELNSSVVTGSPEYYADFVLEGLLKGDIKTRYAAHQMAILTGWKNRNEARIEESYNRGPDHLDEFLEPMNMAQAKTNDQTNPEIQDNSNDNTDSTETAKRLAGVLQRNAERLVNKEVSAIVGSNGKKGAAARFAGNPDGWREWLATFYAEHAQSISSDLGVSVVASGAYCDGQRARFAVLSAVDVGVVTQNSIAALMRLTPA